MKKFIVAALLALSTMTSNLTFAQEKSLTSAEQAEHSATITTARALASYGEAKGDALALVMAAKMISGVPGRVAAPGQDPAAGADKLTPFDTGALLTKAKELAPNDALVTKVADDLAKQPQQMNPNACWWIERCNYYGCWLELWCN